MPVPVVAPVAPAPQPKKTRLTLDEKIVQAKVAVEYEAKRVGTCSLFFLVVGLGGLLSGVNSIFTARSNAEFIAATHQLPWGNKNFTTLSAELAKNSTNTSTVLRAEFELYDLLKNMSFLTMAISFFVLVSGRFGRRAATKQKAKVAQSMFRRSFGAFLAFLIFYVITRKQSRTFTGLFKKMTEADKNQTTAANATEAHGRGLRARYSGHHGFGGFGDFGLDMVKSTAECRVAYDTEFGCNADHQCAWCQAAVAGSACYSMADAKVLPSEVFQCAGQESSNPKVVVDQNINGHHLHFETNMVDNADDLDDLFGKVDLPEEVKNMMEKMRNVKPSFKESEEEDSRMEDHAAPELAEESSAESKSEKFDGRKAAYRMFAPQLWEAAQEQDRRGRHGRHHPSVMADKSDSKHGDKKDGKDATKDWPKYHNMCPVILFLIFAMIFNICHLKFLEKAIANLDFLMKAKKLLKKNARGPTGAQRVATQPAGAITNVMPVSMMGATKHANKQFKLVQPVQFANVIPQIYQPAANQVASYKIEAPEDIHVNESFDYSLTDPLVTDIEESPSAMHDEELRPGPSSGNIAAPKNSMI